MFGRGKIKKFKDAFLDHVTVHHADLGVSVTLENDFDEFIRDTANFFMLQLEEIDREMKKEDIGFVEVAKET